MPRRDGELLVRFREEASEEAKGLAVTSRGGRRKKTLRGEGRLEKVELTLGQDPALAAEALRLDPSVEWAEPNYLVTRAQLVPDDEGFAQQWYLRNTGQGGGRPGADVGAADAWRVTTGDASFVVAVIDSGIDFTHADLRDNRWANARERADGRDNDYNGYTDDLHGYDWVADAGAGGDFQGHGTAVASVIAARGNDGVGITGMMWRASLMSLRVLDSTGAGDVASAVEAIDYAVAEGATVINCSWGTDAESQMLRDAIGRAGARGVVVVAAAGNAGRDTDATPYYPASFNLPNLISVAATDKFDNLAQFSNWGATRVAIAAPGTEILAAKMGGGHWIVSGTSVSAPLVSGIVGLVRTARPWLGAAEIRQILLENARFSESVRGRILSGGVASASRIMAALPDPYRQPPGGGGGNGRQTPRPGLPGHGGQDQNDFKGTPPPTSGAPAPLPDLDDIREHAVTTSDQSPSQITAALRNCAPGDANYPDCDGTFDPGGSDPESSAPRTDPRNETGRPGVDLGSQNFNWGVSLVSLAGRAGHDLDVSLFYNSLVWTKHGRMMRFNADRGYPSPGFRLGLPTLQPSFYNPQTGGTSYLMITPSGGRVELRSTADPNVFEAADGSHTRLTTSGGHVVRTSDGTQYFFSPSVGGEMRCAMVKDRNGNYISASHDANGHLTSITDTLGRVITFNYDAANPTLLSSITQPGNGLTHPWARFVYGELNVSVNFRDAQGALVVNGPNNSTVNVLTQLWLVDNSRYEFTYNSYGQVYLVRHVAPDGHTLTRTLLNLPLDASAQQPDCPRFTEQRDWVERGVMNQDAELLTTYSLDPNGAWSEVTLPDRRTKHKEYFATTGWQKGLTTRTEVIYDGVVKKWTTLQWTQDDESLPFARNPRVRQTETEDAEGNLSRTVVNYVTQSGVSLPSEVLDYGKVAGTMTLLRRSTTEYRWDAAYISRRIIGLADRAHVYDGAGSLVAKVSFGYDWDANGDHFVDTPAPATQHDRAGYGPGFIYGRGNLSVVTRYDVSDPNNAQDTWQESKVRHNSTGSVVMERDHLWHAVYFDYTDSFSDNTNRQTFAYRTRATDPAGYQSTAQYNYALGATTRTTRPTGGTTAAANVTYETRSLAYDDAGRLENLTVLNNNARTRFVYPSSQTYVQTFSTIKANDSEAYAVQFFDGAGRVYASTADHPGSVGGYRASWTRYDAMGRAVQQSRPTEVNASGTPAGDDSTGLVWTLQAYDWQGRPTLQTNGDATTRKLSYAGCGCAGGGVVTARDERGRRRKLYSDALGRTTKVEELNWNQSVYSTTTYAYNGRDQLTQINHAGQVRTFEYDGHGRLRRRTTPEQGVTTYEYNRDDTVHRITDARGTTTTITRDHRHAPTSITYGTPAGVAATSPASFQYDAAGNRARMTDGLGTVNYHYDSLGRMDWEERAFNGVAGAFRLGYAYDLAGNLTSFTNHGGAQVGYTRDHTGRVTAVTGDNYAGGADYVKPGVEYRAFGGLKRLTYGNNRQLNATYDSRMRLSRWNVADVLGWDYSYDKFGEGTGRVTYARNLTEPKLDRSYDYDHVGRMTVAYSGEDARAHVGIAGAQWGIQDGPYASPNTYDVHGNITSRQGWGGANPWFSATYTNNRRAGFTYDSAGNLLNDGSQSFTYDANNQQATAAYTGYTLGQAYDGDTLRAKKRENGVATFYLRSSVFGGQVVAELSEAGAWQRGFVYLESELLAVQQAGAVSWVHQDPVAKSKRVTDAAGLVTSRVELDPWGGDTDESQNAVQQRRLFTTYDRDGNGSDDAMMRRYNRQHARFDQPDRWNGSYELDNPQSFNRYTYTNNDPVNLIDPSGLDPINISHHLPGRDLWGGDSWRYGPEGVYGGYATGGVSGRGVIGVYVIRGWGGGEFSFDSGAMLGGSWGFLGLFGQRPRNCDPITTQLPASGPGFFAKSSTDRSTQFGTADAIAKLVAFANDLWANGGHDRDLRIGEIAIQGGGRFGKHKGSGHASGVAVDIGLFRKDGKDTGTTIHSSDYDKAATHDLIRHLLDDPNVTRVIHGDPSIKHPNYIQDKKGRHDDHVHVEFGKPCP